MNAKRLSTLFLVITVVTVLVVLIFRVKNGAAADSLAILKTTGLPCGSCYSKITKALESLKSVKIVEVDEERGWVIVGFDTKTVRPEDLAEKANSTGFGSNMHVVQIPEKFRQK